MTPSEAYERAREAWKEAWQMGLDHNQSADTRREWEQKREAAFAEMERLAWQIPGFTGLTPPYLSDSVTA